LDDVTQAQERLGRVLERARAGEDRVLAAVVREEGERLVKLLNGVLAMARLHAPDNHAFDQPMRDLEGALGRLIQLLGAVHLLAVEDQVYVNDIRIRLEGTEAAQDLEGKLRRHGVGGVSFHAPLSEAQFRLLVAAVAANPDPDRPRPALQTALAAQGMDSVELVGIHRFRGSGEKEPAQVRDARAVMASAGSLVDEACLNLGANRVPNPLPLRRVVIEILEAGAGAEALWDDPEGATPYAAHTLRVCRLALLLGRALGLPEGALQDLGVAAMFHDVGYAAREGAELRDGRASFGYAPPFARHPVASARLLLRQRGFHEAKVRRVLAALDHHRRYDDPRGRPSLFGRLLAIVEDYDTWIRPQGGGSSPADALGRLLHGAGTVYDPVLVQLFANALGCFPPGTLLTLADGRQARVVSAARSPETFDAPLVRIERLADGSAPTEETVVDLAQHAELRPTHRQAPAVSPPAGPQPAPDAEAALRSAPSVPAPPEQGQATVPEPTQSPVPGSSASPESKALPEPTSPLAPTPFRDWTPLPDEPAPGEHVPAAHTVGAPASGGAADAKLSAAPRPLFPGALPQLLRDIYTGKRSGFLTLIRGHERRGVRFWHGKIMYGRSTVPEEQMGTLAVHLGIVTEEELERASGIARRENERLGAVLCGLGLLTVEGLQELVGRHARQVLEKAIPWTNGSYQFEAAAEEPSWFEGTRSSLSTADIILEAARAIEDTEVIAWHLGEIDRVIVPATDPTAEAGSCQLTAFDGFVLSRADGRLTAREIMSIVPKDSEAVKRALFGLLCLGFVRYGGQRGAATS
jgi:hypothetical protein